MITIIRSKAVVGSHRGNDWSFLPTVFSAAIGIGIGMAIGNYLGWI